MSKIEKLVDMFGLEMATTKKGTVIFLLEKLKDGKRAVYIYTMDEIMELFK